MVLEPKITFLAMPVSTAISIIQSERKYCKYVWKISWENNRLMSDETPRSRDLFLNRGATQSGG